jgi:hypothetical protein
MRAPVLENCAIIIGCGVFARGHGSAICANLCQFRHKPDPVGLGRDGKLLAARLAQLRDGRGVDPRRRPK